MTEYTSPIRLIETVIVAVQVLVESVADKSQFKTKSINLSELN